jgi:hypothetical protein
MAPSDGASPLADDGWPLLGTFGLKPRLKRPIDRAYSHVTMRFLPMTKIIRRLLRFASQNHSAGSLGLRPTREPKATGHPAKPDAAG